MTTYRTGNHWGVTIVRTDVEHVGDVFSSAARASDQLVAVVVNGDQELAERICALLNAYMPSDCTRVGQWRNHDRYERPADSCTGCTAAKGDPDCPVHQGRKPRGPKPPPLGPGCICDGSGRTCPRHGAVI